MPSAEVNSVMISPHPPRLRMNRRNTVSVTPAMGASTVAGAMRTFPMVNQEGTGVVLAGVVLACVARAPSPASGPELSQYLRTTLFYLSQKDKALQKQGWNLPSEARLGRVRDCLLYTSDAADERSSVDLGGRR